MYKSGDLKFRFNYAFLHKSEQYYDIGSKPEILALIEDLKKIVEEMK